MDEPQRIAGQLRRMYAGEAWHGPSVREALQAVTAAQAVARPAAGAHSIWELVLHMGGSYRLVLRRLRGDGAPLADRDDWPPVPEPTAAAWEVALAELDRLHRGVLAAVEGLADRELDAPPTPGSRFSTYEILHGLVQHTAYHLGQIALLRRG